MKPGQSKLPIVGMGIAGGLVAVWLGIAVAPGADGGLRGMFSALNRGIADPLHFHIVTETPRCVLVCLFLYGLAVLMFVSSGMNFRRGEEYGSAKWGSPRSIDRKYRDRKNPSANLIMTQHVAIGSSQESMYRHRRNLNTVVIGGSGSGKSTTHVLINLLQASHSYVCLDPSGEMLRATGNYLKEHGYTIHVLNLVEPERSDRFNPFLYLRNDDDVCEKVSEGDGLDAQTKSLIDRAVRAVYKDYIKSKGRYLPPLLGDFQAALQKMNNPRAEELALSLERFVDGALNTFSKPTNIDTGNSLICYSLSGLRDQMKPIGTLITLDHLLGRVMRNYKAGKITFVYADEFALLFQDEDTGKFFSNLWRRIRKYNGYCTGATQNCEEVLDSESGRAMLSNTDFVVMLNQSPSNAQRLSELYKITENQRTYFTNTQPGHGLMKIGGAIIPFVLMDNNILACEYGIEQLAGLINSGYKIDLNQGMDARLVTPEVADILARLKWISYLRFSCDQESQIGPILRTCELLKERGVKSYRVFVYLLVTSDLDSASRRVEALKGLRGINLYAQAERNESLGVRPNKAQLEFAQRYVYSGCFRRETWEEYSKRKGLIF